MGIQNFQNTINFRFNCLRVFLCVLCGKIFKFTNKENVLFTNKQGEDLIDLLSKADYLLSHKGTKSTKIFSWCSLCLSGKIFKFTKKENVLFTNISRERI